MKSYIWVFCFVVACMPMSMSEPQPDLAGTNLNEQDLASPVVQAPTRLVQRNWIVNSVQTFPEGVFDTKEQVGCTFRRADDDKIRCLPYASAAYVYADAACTVGLAMVFKTSNTCAGTYQWTSRVEHATCPETYSMWKLGNPRTVTKLYYKQDVSCIDYTTQIPFVTVYDITYHSPTDFVAAELR